MQPLAAQNTARRYQLVDAEKAHGATYTPYKLARFVAEQIVDNAGLEGRTSLTILDPATGDGELVLALLEALERKTNATVRVCGFDTNASALDAAAGRIRASYPQVALDLTNGSFLDWVAEADGDTRAPSLFGRHEALPAYDLVIANPPYVRTQVMGSARAQHLATMFGLAGRVDLYHAFLLGIAQVLAPDGMAGIIVSNRFMTTRGGAHLRASLRRGLALRRIWDLGDTKLFSAAVLPAVIVAGGTAPPVDAEPRFTSIYSLEGPAVTRAADPIDALTHEGIVEVDDGRRFCVRHGVLDTSGEDGGIWRLATKAGDEWMAIVDRHTWKRFGDVGKIRVGVKTCADKIFIRHDWESAFGKDMPELLRPLTTHHEAGRFRAKSPNKVRSILYPHEVVQGSRQAIAIDDFPKSRAYLETHRVALESRSYVIDAGRRWYELWVPQDPQAWSAPKLVFRDISERPTFWIDTDGSVVNGDCYWLAVVREDEADLLWLAAAVANSTFAEAFYDRRFNNKLYAGRRRFITQYVEQFPLPDPSQPLSQEIIARAKAIYEADHAPEVEPLENALDTLVWRSFGLGVEKVGG